MPYISDSRYGSGKPTPREEAEQARLAAQRAAYTQQSGWGGSGDLLSGSGAAAMTAANNAAIAAQAAEDRANSIDSNTAGIASQLAPYQQAVTNQQGIYDNSKQRLDEVRGDPMDKMFQDAVRRQLDTKGLGNQLMSQSGDMAASADSQRQAMLQQQIQQRGGNLNDPSAQAAMAASVSQRQGDVQAGRRDATLAEYQQGRAGLNAGLAYSQNRNNQLNTATNMTNSALAMPVMKRPGTTTSNLGAGDVNDVLAAGEAQAQAGTKKPGFAGSSPSYADFLKSQKG